MGRILAIDYGSKRVGLAVTDADRIIATGLDTIASHLVINYLKAYLGRESVDLIVVGQPLGMHHGTTSVEQNILVFIKALTKNFPEIPIDRYDERFTSKMAFQTMIDAGLKKQDRKDKSLVDKLSAVIILQSYMDHLEHKKMHS